MLNLLTDTALKPYNENIKYHCGLFACDNDDLDDFFCNDAVLYEKELLGKTYCFVTRALPHEIVGVFTIANDSIKTSHLTQPTTNRLNRPISNPKRGRSYPATLIGRLGISTKYQRQHIGTQIIDFLKNWIRDDDTKAGCRFLVVDAYNDQNILNFYLQNGFKYLFATENDERDYYSIPNHEIIKTRLMYYDL